MNKKLVSLSMAVALILGMAIMQSCAKNGHGAPSIKTFVLVHGAWQAPWVWNQVKQQLEQAGQHVIIVQLPAHGNDSTPPSSVSIDIYRNTVINAINSSGIKEISSWAGEGRSGIRRSLAGGTGMTGGRALASASGLGTGGKFLESGTGGSGGWRT